MAQKRTRRKTERRKLPRADARLSMRVEPTEESPSNQLVTESQNISASGVYCSSAHYLAPLSKVSLTLVLPRLHGGGKGNELIKCEGIVVRCEQVPNKRDKRYELACMFSDLEPEHRAMIEEFVTWRNLQALRAAASKATGRTTTRKKASVKRTKKAARPKKTAAKRAHRTISAVSRTRTTAKRKSTSRSRPRAAAAPRRRA